MTRRARCLVLIALLFAACRKGGGEELPNLGQVPAFSLTDQAGRPFSSDQLKNEVWVAAFMFTRCPTVCPRITARMRDLQAEAKRRELPVRFVSFTVDPEFDTPQVLQRYAKQHAADLSTWSFVTGDHSTIQKTSVQGFKLALDGRAQEGAEHYGILHGSHLILLRPGLGIAGYYRSSDDAEMQRLIQDAERLTAR